MGLAIIPALAAALLLQTGQPADSPKLETDEHKTIYALGLAVSQSLSQNLQPFALSNEEVALVLAGLQDGLLKEEPKVDMATYGPRIEELQTARASALAEQEKIAGAEFLMQAAKAKGAVKTDTGVIYQETESGAGEKPTATDTVSVHYHGTLRDGSVFDSSVSRGEPATFALNRVIPCWTEAVQKMRVGGKATITCPADTAYGSRGSGAIKPGAALRFDVELISIKN